MPSDEVLGLDTGDGWPRQAENRVIARRSRRALDFGMRGGCLDAALLARAAARHRRAVYDVQIASLHECKPSAWAGRPRPPSTPPPASVGWSGSTRGPSTIRSRPTACSTRWASPGATATASALSRPAPTDRPGCRAHRRAGGHHQAVRSGDRPVGGGRPARRPAAGGRRRLGRNVDADEFMLHRAAATPSPSSETGSTTASSCTATST